MNSQEYISKLAAARRARRVVARRSVVILSDDRLAMVRLPNRAHRCA